jgi:hypothetical protein
MHSDVCELMLNPEGLLCVDFKYMTSTYIDALLKKQTRLLVNELRRVHAVNSRLSMAYTELQPSLFLKKKSSGLLRLDNISQQAFYEKGVLELAITGHKEGTLYVYTLASKIHANYVEYAYFFGVRN